MNLIEELLFDLPNSGKSLSEILRKVKILSYQLDNSKLKHWIDNELNGYSNEVKEIPDYRKIYAESYGHFLGSFDSEIKNAPIPTLNLPEKIRKHFDETVIKLSIGAIENLLKNEEGTFQIPWPADVIAIVSRKIYKGYSLAQAWRAIAPNQLIRILENVRNRLLTFILELKKISNNLTDEKTLENLPKANVQKIFNTYIIGNQNIISCGENVEQNVNIIRKNDFHSLEEYLRKNRVSDGDIDELKSAIEKDKEPEEKGKYGDNVNGWISNMIKKSLDGVWKIGSQVAITILTQALLQYYGL